MPNRSNTSRSYQLAARHTPVTESISGFSPRQPALQAQPLYSLRASADDRPLRSAARAGYQSTAVTVLRRTNSAASFRKRHDVDDLRRSDLQRQFAPVEFPPSHASRRIAVHARGHGMFFQIFGKHCDCSSAGLLASGPPDQSSAPFFQM